MIDLAGQGYLFFSPNRTNKHSIQRFCKLSKRFPKRTQNEHCRTKTNRKRTAKTAYLRGLNCFVRLFGEDCDTPLHLCSHLRHAALCGVFGKQLGELVGANKALTNRLTVHKLASPLPSPVTVTVTLKITQTKVFHSVGDGSDGKTAQGRLPSPLSI